MISGNLEDFDLRNSCFWDLFCGSGAIGLEALSRGANKVVFLDVEISAILKNIQALNVGEDALVLKRNFRKLGENLKAYKEFPPQVVFADPPYSYWQEESFFNDLILSLEKLKSPHLFIEHPAEIKLQSHSNITKVWTRKYGNCCLSYFLPS